MKIIGVVGGVAIGSMLGLIGTVVGMNLVGALCDLILPRSPWASVLFFLSIGASPHAAVIGGVVGGRIGWRRASDRARANGE